MGSLFRLLEIHEDTMGKKVVTHKRLLGGLEAPRNSLELPLETSYGLYSGRDNILYDYHITKESSEMNCCSIEAPIKKLIREEISNRQNSRQSAPSVVARLMGVDMLPFDSKSAQLVDIKSETSAVQLLRKEQSEKSLFGHVPSTLNSPQRLDFGFCGYNTDRYSDQRVSHKPKPREHPQEEELQKFKKEFEAWQAARIKECSQVVEFSSAPSQLIAQEDLNREKMFLYANSRRVTTSQRLMEPKDLAVIAGSDEMLTSSNRQKRNDHLLDEVKECLYSNRRSSSDYRTSRSMKYDKKADVVSAPTKIVILRPGPDRMGMTEDSWNSTPSSSEERGSIVDFLEEVKERLKSELQGKSSKRTSTARGGGIETPFREKPSEPRQIAQRIAQQVRDGVTRDLGMSLIRSASTRSYRSDIQLNSTGSPEFSNKDTRRFLAERLRNVLNGEKYPEFPMVSHYSSRSSDYERARAGQSKDIGIGDKRNHPESISSELEKRSRSFRREPDEGQLIHEETSPRNLVRSLSAPVSGTSFGKLLLEDRHILTGAQIRRKHEVIEKVPVNVQKQKKDKFNIKEKVSSFRYSLTLRGRLFRRRIQSIEGSPPNKNDLLNDISSGPTVMMSFYETHENSTEVPPSPASVCSSVHEDFCRSADYSSPASSLGVHQMEDNEAPQVFREINSNLNELRRKLNELESAVLPNTITEHQPYEVETDIEDQDEAYVRDLLVASGLYDTSCNQSLSKWDPLGKPISNQVFEEVEESYRQCCEKNQGELLNHKILLDLLNEALPSILKPSMSMSRYMEIVKCSISGLTHEPPQGRELLSRVWEMIRVYVYPPEGRLHYALDNMVSRDLKSNPWIGLMSDDLFALGRDVECLIIGDLICEIVKDMLR